MVSHDFQTNSLSVISPQIIARESTVPSTMQTMQIVKQILFKRRKSIAIDLLENHAYVGQTASNDSPFLAAAHSQQNSSSFTNQEQAIPFCVNCKRVADRQGCSVYRQPPSQLWRLFAITIDRG